MPGGFTLHNPGHREIINLEGTTSQLKSTNSLHQTEPASDRTLTAFQTLRGLLISCPLLVMGFSLWLSWSQ